MANPKAQGWAAVIFVAAFFIIAVAVCDEESSQDSAPVGGSSEQTYTLQFGESFQPGLALKDDLGISVVLAVDVSGSMSAPPAGGGAAKYQQATQALTQVLDVLERLTADSGQVVRLGLLRFHSEVEPVLEVSTLSPANLAGIRRRVSDPRTWEPQGATAIGRAVEVGAEWLAQSGTILRSLIVVTDGENTEGVEPSWALSALYNNRNNKSSTDFPVSTSSTLVSFIGFDIGSGYFEPLGQYGARVTSASDQVQLARTLSNLLEADITKLEAPSLGGR